MLTHRWSWSISPALPARTSGRSAASPATMIFRQRRGRGLCTAHGQRVAAQGAEPDHFQCADTWRLARQQPHPVVVHHDQRHAVIRDCTVGAGRREIQRHDRGWPPAMDVLTTRRVRSSWTAGTRACVSPWRQIAGIVEMPEFGALALSGSQTMLRRAAHGEYRAPWRGNVSSSRRAPPIAMSWRIRNDQAPAFSASVFITCRCRSRCRGRTALTPSRSRIRVW